MAMRAGVVHGYDGGGHNASTGGGGIGGAGGVAGFQYLHRHGDQFGGNPVGDNAEITAALTGNNPKHLNFIPAEAGLRINATGELMDPWGTPFFFHQLSGHDMEIHSAGPDLKMWTYDDLVQR